MSHLIEERDGQTASVVSVRETPWHQLGTVLPEAPSFDEALDLAHIDYEVDLVPLYYHKPVSIGDHIEAAVDASAVIRTDINTPLGVVGSGYTPVQNRAAFEVLTPLIDNGIATIETAGVLSDGTDAWMLVRFADEKMGDMWKRAGDRDPLAAYGLASNNHNGRRAVRFSVTPVRVVCANTLNMADASTERVNLSTVSHRGSEADVAERLVDAAERVFVRTREAYEACAGDYLRLQDRIITEAQFRTAVLDLISPVPVQTSSDAKPSPRYDLIRERAELRRLTLSRLFWEGVGQDGTPTAWAAYNAVTEALDHDVDAGWPTRGDRVTALTSGRLGQMKRQALNSLLSLGA